MSRHLTTDAELLNMLHMRDHGGMTCREIAEAVGRSRMSVVGALNRINKETDKHDLTPELNGTMPPKWWEKGLRKQK